MRSASPSLWVRSTTASSRYRGTRSFSPTEPAQARTGGVRRQRSGCGPSSWPSSWRGAPASTRGRSRRRRWSSRSGRNRHSRMRGARSKPDVGQLRGQHRRRRRRGGSGRSGGRRGSAGAWIATTLAADGASRPKMTPCTHRGHGRGRWSHGVEPDARPRTGTIPRGTGRVSAAQRVDRERQEPRGEQHRHEGQDPGDRARCRAPASRRSGPGPARGRCTATSRETLAPSEVPPMTACSAPRWSSSATTCSPNDGHRVDQRVGRPVGAAVPEQVEGHHVQPLRGHRAGERLVHPARHQQAVQQHDPVVARAVLGVLQPVAPTVGLDEELSDPLADQHGPNVALPALSRG